MVHNYNFDVPGDGQMYTTVEDLLRWDDYLHGAERPAIHELMLTEGVLNDGNPIGYAQGIELGEYRGLRTLQHTGSSWGSRSVLMRFVDPGLAIAIACNDGNSDPRGLALKVADHYLSDRLGPESDGDESGADGQGPVAATGTLALPTPRLSGFTGAFFSPELDATYRFAVVGNGLVVQIEQEPPLAVLPVGVDRFEFSFHPQGWSEPRSVSLEFNRDESGLVSGFSLSSGAERGILFAKRH
jgi:hypothetical protein